VDQLTEIAAVFDSAQFRTLMQACAVGQGHINWRVIAAFRTDFWREFVV
jgi:hypothetical protein